MQISVLGAGAWGTALAAQAATRHPTRLWARDPAQAAAIAASRRNARYLADVALPDALDITDDLAAALAHAGPDGLLIVATPMAGLREMLQRLPDGAAVLWLKQDAAYQPPLDCAPCFERECPLGHLDCLNKLYPQQVLTACLTGATP